MLVPHEELDAMDGVLEPFPSGRNESVSNNARDSQDTQLFKLVFKDVSSGYSVEKV